MFTWLEKDGKHECHYEAQRGDVVLGTIEPAELVSFDQWTCKVNTGMIDDIKVIQASFRTWEMAKEFVEAAGHKRLCTECNKLHSHGSWCECGACLYEHGKSQNDPNYPFFTCMKCKRTNFWD